MIMMALFTFTDGITLGVMLISIDENLAINVAWLTALIMLFAGTIGLYSKVDFGFLGRFLLWALIALIVVTFFRILEYSLILKGLLEGLLHLSEY
jgi:FtsH-binding integral membrane protein